MTVGAIASATVAASRPLASPGSSGFEVRLLPIQRRECLHVLLATLLVWLTAAFVATIPFAPMSFPRIFNTAVQETCYATALVLLRLGHFRRATLAYLAGTWIWATLRRTQPGSTTLRVLASFGGMARRHKDSGWVAAQRAGIYGSGDDARESSVPASGNATGNLVHNRTGRPDQRHPGGTGCGRRLRNCSDTSSTLSRWFINARTKLVQARDQAESANRGQERVPGQYEPRTSYAPQRHPGILRPPE